MSSLDESWAAAKRINVKCFPVKVIKMSEKHPYNWLRIQT